MVIMATTFIAAARGGPPAPDGGHTLWKIGTGDGRGATFALAPDGFARFEHDGFFVVGRSDPKRDWPYVHPGPDDSWAGSRRHTFTIAFGIKARPSAPGTCTLEMAVVDTQSSVPPELSISLNGHERRQHLAPGGGDASIAGRLGQAKHARLALPFPSDELKEGTNVLTITTLSGSWLLYDSLELRTPESIEPAPAGGTVITELEVRPGLREREGKLCQSARLTVVHVGEDVRTSLKVGAVPPANLQLHNGVQDVEIQVSDTGTETALPVEIEAGGKTLAARSFALKPQRRLTVYILPHSHTDIGYTEVQTRIEQKQVDNLLQGIAYARKTAAYPEGARFVWNVEVLWAADLYLHRLSPAQRSDFLEAVKDGQVVAQRHVPQRAHRAVPPRRAAAALPLFHAAGRADGRADRLGDDQRRAGLHLGYGHRHGAGRHQVLLDGSQLLRPHRRHPGEVGKPAVLLGLAFGQGEGAGLDSLRRATPCRTLIHELSRQGSWPTTWPSSTKTGYPYDIAYVRWSGHGDNASPDPAICEFVKQWNAEHAWPTLRHLLDQRRRSGPSRRGMATSCRGSAATGRPTGRMERARRPWRPG